MVDLIASVSRATALAKRLMEISEKVRNAEFRNLLADLSLELADVKLKLVGVLEENVTLKDRIRELESVEGEPCPKCHKRGWQIESSTPDGHFGRLGGIRRTYKCSFCGFSESILVTPK